MSRRTTLSEIAEAAGVSLATVDRVINNRGGVSPRREAQVLEAARALNLDRVSFRTPRRTVRIAFVMAPPANPYYRSLSEAIAQETAAVAHLNVQSQILRFERPTPAAIVGTLERLDDYDIAVVTCPAEDAVTRAVQRLTGRMPVITFNNDVPGSGRLAYVGPDHTRLGRVAGELMGRFLGREGGGILFIAGFRAMVSQRERERGFLSVLSERFPACAIVGSAESRDAPAELERIVRETLRSHPGLRGIYNASAGSHVVARVVDALGAGERPVHITHELTPERRALLRQGTIDAVINQNLRAAAREVLDLALRQFGRAASDLRSDDAPFEVFLRENC